MDNVLVGSGLVLVALGVASVALHQWWGSPCWAPSSLKTYEEERAWKREHAKTCERCADKLARIDATIAERKRLRAAGLPYGGHRYPRYVPRRDELVPIHAMGELN